MGTDAGVHVGNEILGADRRKSASKKKILTADARASTLELRSSRCAAIDSSGIVRCLSSLHQIQASGGAFCCFEGIKQWNFFSCFEPIRVPEPFCQGFPIFGASSAETEGYRLSEEERGSALAHSL
jgi:hypothetical protein